MRKRYGTRCALAIENWFAKKANSGNYDCMDNERVALASSNSERRRYKRKRNNGCCGYEDDIITVGWLFKKSFMVGFNYGH